MIVINKLIISILFTFPILYFLPWWISVFPGLIIGYAVKDIKSGMIISSFSLMISWAVILIYRWVVGGDILMARVAIMMNVNNSFILACIILLIPILIGALSGLTGKFLKETLD